MDRFSEWLGGPQVVVKRDDLTGLALGGNKARKLEFLCGEAQAQGCDVLVTGGGAQSNHARMTAAAANRLGFDCHLAVGGKEPSISSGNLLLDRVLGATLHFTGADSYYEVESAIEEVAAAWRRTAGARSRCRSAARPSRARPRSWAADELLGQVDEDGHGSVDWIVVADGSGGTHAGLLAGLGGQRTCSAWTSGHARPRRRDPRLAVEAAARAGRATPRDELVLDHSRFGDGYGAVTDGALEAIDRVAGLEGVILDPVYTGKAMAGLIGAAARDASAPATRSCSGTPAVRRRPVRPPLRRAVLRP